MKSIFILSLLTLTTTFSNFSNAQSCSSTRDYETGLKNGLKMAPPCELTNAKLPKCIGEYNVSTWSNCYGERTAASGGTYRGGYLDGKANGKGEFVNPDGTRYLGDYAKGQRNGSGKEYAANGTTTKEGLWSNGVFAGDSQTTQYKTTASTSNQKSLPLNGMNDAMKAALEIAGNNPRWINHLMTNSNIDEVALCSAIGMKMMAFAAVNPDSLDGSVAKVHALNAAGMSKAMQALIDKGAMPKGYVMNYVKIFNPQSMQEVLDKNWQTCDRSLEIKLIDRNELTLYLRRPYVK